MRASIAGRRRCVLEQRPAWNVPMIELRRRTVTFGLAAAAFMPPRLARGATAQLTFILTNDIYQMGDTLMPDGQRRGGFARLAAVVKAERAKGGHVLFAHGGDTLSPSLMSGVDQGAHIMALTNTLKPDIFVPGNHEFDFGKAVFLKRMAEAKFPVFAANLTGADGRLLAGFKDRDFIGIGDMKIGITGAAHDRTPQMSNVRGSEIPARCRCDEGTSRGFAPRRRRPRGRRDARRPQAGL